jgi:hypothetical protein
MARAEVLSPSIGTGGPAEKNAIATTDASARGVIICQRFITAPFLLCGDFHLVPSLSSLAGLA